MRDPIPTDLPDLPPMPDEADIAAPGDGTGPQPEGFPRLDVARKLQRQVAFLAAFRDSGVVAEACRRIGISRRLVYGFWRRDPLFEAAYQEAQEEAADVVEAELHRRGVLGIDEPVIHMGIPTMIDVLDEDGQPTGRTVPFTIKKYSDGCLMALIKARKPEQFRERSTVDMKVEGGSGVLVVPAAVDAEAWAAAAEREQARFRPDGAPPPKKDD